MDSEYIARDGKARQLGFLTLAGSIGPGNYIIALNLLAEKRSSTGGDLSAAGGPDNVCGIYMGYPKGASRPLGIAGSESARSGNVAKAGA